MNKINIFWIIRNHVNSLKDDGETSLSRGDIYLHFVFPLVISFFICFYFNVMPSSVVGIMVNFGSITTALLMSAAVMVYDQKSKIIEKKEIETIEDKKATYNKNIALYKELCQNICFAIFTSILIVILTVALSFYEKGMESVFYHGLFITISFLCYALFISTMITFLMILKRFGIILDN